MGRTKVRARWRWLATVLIGVASVVAAFNAGRSSAAGAAEPLPLVYSGTLLGTDGAPATGVSSIEIRFWGSSARVDDGLCTTGEQTDFSLTDGRFSLPLPAECRAALKPGVPVFVEVVVNGTSLGRTRVGAAPFAMEAEHSATAERAADADRASAATGDLQATLSALQASTDSANSAASDLRERIAQLQSSAEQLASQVATIGRAVTDCAEIQGACGEMVPSPILQGSVATQCPAERPILSALSINACTVGTVSGSDGSFDVSGFSLHARCCTLQ